MSVESSSTGSSSAGVSSAGVSSLRASTKTRPDRLASLIKGPPTAFPPLQLTFGVEIECILLFKYTWYDQNIDKLPLPQDGSLERPKDIDEWIKEDLENRKKPYVKHLEPRNNPLENYYDLVAEAHVRSRLRAIEAHVCKDYDKGSYNAWVVDRDISVVNLMEPKKMFEERWGFIPMELKAPILKYDARAVKQVMDVLETLKENFNDRVNFRFEVNDSSDLHVHVGTQQREQNLLTNARHLASTMTNLYTLGLFFEKQISTIFPAGKMLSFWAAPVSRALCEKGDLHGAAAYIEESPRSGELGKEWGIEQHLHTTGTDSMRYRAYNLRPLITYGTIEFRQHHGSLDPEAVSSWVRFVCGLIRVSHRAGKAGFPASFLDRSFEKGFDFPAFLTALNMDGVKDYYGRPGVLFEHPPVYDWELSPGVYKANWVRPTAPTHM